MVAALIHYYYLIAQSLRCVLYVVMQKNPGPTLIINSVPTILNIDIKLARSGVLNGCGPT